MGSDLPPQPLGPRLPLLSPADHPPTLDILACPSACVPAMLLRDLCRSRRVFTVLPFCHEDGEACRDQIAWLPGDGVGIDVMDATRIVFDRLKLDAEYIHGDIGWEFWCAEGDALPPRTIELLSHVDAALFGAITSNRPRRRKPNWRPSLQGTGLDLPLADRPHAAAVRPVPLPPPLQGIPGNPLNLKDDIDIVVFRENTEDLYAGVEFNPVPPELADTLRAVEAVRALCRPEGRRVRGVVQDQHAQGSERIIDAAFAFARKHGRRRWTVVHKANVVRATDGMFLEISQEVAARYPEITFDEANVDAMTMWLLKNPMSYDVLVAPNLYGDIVSDLCAQMVGGLGFACSGNIGTKLAVFEPAHGSAPKYTGQYKVNPIATILAAKMMLDWLGELRDGRARRSVVTASHQAGAGPYATDMGGAATHRWRWRRRSPESSSMANITIHEVGMRDGLQIEEQAVPTGRKLDWIARLAGAGLPMIQVGSFVNPQKVPQMADTDELFRRLAAVGPPAARRLFGPGV